MLVGWVVKTKTCWVIRGKGHLIHTPVVHAFKFWRDNIGPKITNDRVEGVAKG
jgi:hypothetical protein